MRQGPRRESGRCRVYAREGFTSEHARTEPARCRFIWDPDISSRHHARADRAWGSTRSMGMFIRGMIPEYADGWKSKMVISDPTTNTEFAYFSLVVRSPDGTEVKKRLPAEAYLKIVALSNFKQRTRKMLEYHYADRFNYAVGGTSNCLETDQGFFVKLGDGSGDFKPIAHLYKSQIFQLAEYLGVPRRSKATRPFRRYSFASRRDKTSSSSSCRTRKWTPASMAKGNAESLRMKWPKPSGSKPIWSRESIGISQSGGAGRTTYGLSRFIPESKASSSPEFARS